MMILVTGSTGAIGGEVVRLLSCAGTSARALIRNPNQRQELSGITWVTGDLGKPATLPSAFADCRTLFLLSGNGENAGDLQHNALWAARQAGIAHVVKLSAFGASPRSNSLIGRLHYQIEKELEESGMAWTMLRPHHFSQNLLSQAGNIIKRRRGVFVIGRRQDSVRRHARHRRRGGGHTDAAGSRGQEVRRHRR